MPLTFESFLGRLPVKIVRFTPLIQARAAYDERGTNRFVEVFGADNGDREIMLDPVHGAQDCAYSGVMSTEITDETIVATFKKVLKSKGVSLRRISDDLQIPYRTVQNYLGGETRIPADFFLRVCNYIGIEADYFLYGNFRPNSSDLYDAVYVSLERMGLLPPLRIERSHDGITESSNASERIAFAVAMTTAVAEQYDRFRMGWLERKDGGERSEPGKRPPAFFEHRGKVGQ